MSDPTIRWSDDRLDAELREFLAWQARQLIGAPTAAEMTAHVRGAVGADRRTMPGVDMRLLAWVVVAALVAVAVAAAYVAGHPSSPTFRNGQILVGGQARDPMTGAVVEPACAHCGDATPSWSADGTVYAVLQGMIRISDPATGELRDVTDCDGCSTADDPIDLSPDGRTIAFVERGDLLIVDARTGIRSRLAELAAGDSAIGPSFSPDGLSIAFSGSWLGGIWTVGTDGADLRQILDERLVSGVDWSPDGRRIAYLSEYPVQSWLLDVQSGTRRRLFQLAGCCIASVPGQTWSPDGTQIAIAAGARTNLWVVDAASGAARSLGTTPEGMPAWQPVPW